ncbi:MAG: hypothetical protein Q7R87_02170 [Nanoarchaeota archaeon]|nr:hypothetical protein [Nanoarchaeota archaeon]
MEFIDIFKQEFERMWDAVIIGVVSAMIFFIMSYTGWSLKFRILISFLSLFDLIFMYALLLALQRYFKWF